MAIKNIPQFHRAKKKFHIKTFNVNGVFLAILSLPEIKGGYSSWGDTRENAMINVMNLAGNYIKQL